MLIMCKHAELVYVILYAYNKVNFLKLNFLNFSLADIKLNCV